MHLLGASWTLHRRPGLALKMALNKSWDQWEKDHPGHVAPLAYREAIEKIDDNDMLQGSGSTIAAEPVAVAQAAQALGSDGSLQRWHRTFS